jgi:hypothetical protein
VAGDVSPSRLVHMSVEEMAPERLQKERERIAKRFLEKEEMIPVDEQTEELRYKGGQFFSAKAAEEYEYET